ncbi:MAG: phosphatidylglycerol lysyltransferase domain-containing protein [bacterium]|nr:phosphatidylglycerol lysyltransferase domain-containing protein [bacterium]
MTSSIVYLDGFGLAATAAYSIRFIRDYFRSKKAVSGPKATSLLDIFSRHANCPHALVSLGPESMAWRSGDDAAGVSFIEGGKFWLAAGDPIAEPSARAAAARDFAAAARAKNRMPVFLPSTEEFARQMRDEGWSCLKLGASPYFDLETWNPRGNVARHLRSSVNKAIVAGVTVTESKDIHSLRSELDSLCSGWLKTRPAGTSFGWLFALNPMGNAGYKRFYVARDKEGALVGLLAASPIPSRNGWYLEDVIRAPGSAAGVCDILVYNVLRSLQSEGFKTATLGTVLLTDDGEDFTSAGDWEATQRNLKIAKRVLSGFYNFDGLHHFKVKFVPTRWEAEYLVLPEAGNALHPLRITMAAMKAIMPRGIWPIIRYLITHR